MTEFKSEGFSCRAEKTGELPKLVVLFGGFDKGLFRDICALTDFKGVLAEFGEIDWDRDYSPWEADIGDNRHFGGGADRLVKFLPEFIAELEKRFGEFREIYLCGYSLGGIFALYAAALGGEISGAASCSGSMWFPGWTEFLKSHALKGKIYLSLGGKEKNSPDPLMASVEVKTLEAKQIIAKTADVCFVHEAGGHFSKIPQRMCRAISALAGDEPASQQL